MKKFLAIFAFLAVAGSYLHAVDVTSGSPPFVSVYGGNMYGNSAIQLGVKPRELSVLSFPAYAACTITAGDVLIFAGTTYPASVSKSTTVGIKTAGVALTSAYYGEVVQVAYSGVALVKVAQTTVIGQMLVQGGAVGLAIDVTNVATVSLTSTCLVGQVMQSKTSATLVPVLLK